MNRMIMAFCAALTMAAFGLGATPASAYVGEYSFSDRTTAERPARAERRSARTSPGTRTPRQRTVSSSDDAAPRATRGTTRRTSTSLTGGAMRGSGMASYYWQPQRVASGGWFNPNAMTAAHKTLPFGTRVRVTNLNNGRSVTVRINDRGPYIAGRVIDLSRAAATAVGMIGSGVARVNLAVLGR
jgi:rare lipoprotein A